MPLKLLSAGSAPPQTGAQPLEREEISRGLSTQRSLRWIARQLGRSAPTISREVSRNGGLDRYRAARSDQAAWDLARRPKLCQTDLPAARHHRVSQARRWDEARMTPSGAKTDKNLVE